MHRPNPTDSATFVEREALKLVLQQPDLVAGGYQQVRVEAFTNPAYAAVHGAVEAAGGPPSERVESGLGGHGRRTSAGRAVRSLVTELAVEPPRNDTRRGQRPVRRRHPRRDGATGRRGGRTQPAVGAAAGRGLGGHRGEVRGCRPTWRRWPTTGGRWRTGHGGTGDVADRLPSALAATGAPAGAGSAAGSGGTHPGHGALCGREAVGGQPLRAVGGRGRSGRPARLGARSPRRG